jgi:hypothetical protein
MKKPLKTSVEGRKCKFPECTCILSIYNDGVYCRIHQEQMTQSERAKTAINPAAAMK